MDFQEQIRAYTAWINSQLKKRSQHINDLGHDLRDGFVLGTVVEIVSGYKIDAVQATNDDEKRENLQKIVKFMINSGIKLHHVSIEEIMEGNVKTIMQLILALAAHFKPASIGGRKHNLSEKSQRSPVTALKNYRWKKDETTIEEINDAENKLNTEIKTDLSNVRTMAENLQKLLLDELKDQPISDPIPFEESCILRAQLDQAKMDNQRLQNEIDQLKSQLHTLTTEKTVFESRARHHEQEILVLKQELLSTDIEKEKLNSENAGLQAKLSETHRQRERLLKQGYKKDMLLQEISEQLHFVKTEQVIHIARKDREIAHLRRQIDWSSQHTDGEPHADVYLYPNSSAATKRCDRPDSPVYLLPNSSIVSRPSPLHKTKLSNNARRSLSKDFNQTKVLYFTDRDMTPSTATISKKVGDITLRDFKEATKKDGSFRYIFKALDPELGTVKEEVVRNDDILPGWEGKIVAWIEEEVRV